MRLAKIKRRLIRVGDNFFQVCLRSFDRNSAAYLSTAVMAAQVVKLVLIVCSHSLLPSHQATGVKTLSYSPSSSAIGTVVSPFLCWDAAHFVSIAVYGYTDAMSYAFFPLFPLTLELLSEALSAVLPISLNAIERVVICGVLLSNICFIFSCVVLNELLKAYSVPAIKRHCAILCFAMNPASIFFSVVYSESLFSLLSWSAMYLLSVKRQVFLPAVLFACASYTRSNGIFNCVFVVAVSLNKYGTTASMAGAIAETAPLFLVFLATVLPYYLHALYTQSQLCINTSFPSDVCFDGSAIIAVIHLYSRIQKKYWNVSFLASLHLKQTPNIALAVPVITVTVQSLRQFVKLASAHLSAKNSKFLKDLELMPFHAVMSCNLFVCLFFAHVQISTRVIFASAPLIYLTMSDNLLEIKSGYRAFTAIYILLFNVLGIVLHPNFYPWT